MKTILILTHVNNEESLFSSFVYYHAQALEKLGNKVIIFAVKNYFPLIKKKIKKQVKIINNIEIHYLNRISFSNFLINSKINLNGITYYSIVNKEIKKLLSKTNIDLIDAHFYKAEGYAAYKLKRKYNIKTTITLHGTSFTRSYNSKNGKKDIIKISNYIDYYICVSEKIQKMLNSLKISNSKAIYNGINSYDEKNSKKENNIITVGSFTPVKNIDIVIKSFKKILEIYPNIKLVIVGSGPLENELKKLSYDIKDNVLFTGQISNKMVFEYLNKSNIFLLPSSPEGFGIVYVEAMLNKCITIGTKNEGIDGFIKNEENGFLVNPNVDEIVSLINNILNNKYDLDKIRSNAYNDAKKLTWEKNAKEYLKLIGEK